MRKKKQNDGFIQKCKNFWFWNWELVTITCIVLVLSVLVGYRNLSDSSRSAVIDRVRESQEHTKELEAACEPVKMWVVEDVIMKCKLHWDRYPYGIDKVGEF